MNTRTLLAIIQEVARRHGIAQPSAVVASSDETIQQLYGLANETVEEMNERYTWPELITPFTFHHGSLDSNYAAIQISGNNTASTTVIADWKKYIQNTLWDTTAGLELIGPLDESEWTAAITLGIQAGRYQFRFYGKYLYIYPKPTVLADVSFRLEYYSSAPVYDTTGATAKEWFTVDTDYCRLPARMLVQGIRWRYKKEKGLPYAEDKDSYEMACADWTSNTGQQTTVRMDGDCGDVGPMIIVPPGSWPL